MTSVGEVYKLFISGMTIKMAGVYKVVAINEFGTAEHSAEVTVGTPKPKEQPKPVVEPKPVEEPQPVVEEPQPVVEEPKPVEEPVPVQEPVQVEQPAPVEEPKPEPKPEGDAPQFVETYQEMSIIEKTNLDIQVKCIGKPAPEVKWFR